MKLYKIKNQAFSVKQMKKYEPELIKIIENSYKILRNPIPVTFIIKPGLFKPSKDTSTLGFMHSHKDKFFVTLYADFIVKYIFSAPDFVHSVLLHELSHVYDHFYSLYSPKCAYDYNTPLKSEEAFLQKLGYCLWTEFFAHGSVYYYFSANDFLTLKELTTELKTLRSLFDNFNKKPCQQSYDLLFDNVDNFSYLLSKSCAGYSFGKKKKHKYCESTLQDKDFIFVTTLLKKLNSLLIKIYNRPYTIYFKKQIHNIGKILYDKLFKPFSFEIYKQENQLFSIGIRKVAK